MQTHSSRPVRTFTIGFDDERYNEAPHPAAIARRLGTEHTEMMVQPKDALDLIPALPHTYDEPFADSSQITTMLVTTFTRAHLTVALDRNSVGRGTGVYHSVHPHGCP